MGPRRTPKERLLLQRDRLCILNSRLFGEVTSQTQQPTLRRSARPGKRVFIVAPETPLKTAPLNHYVTDPSVFGIDNPSPSQPIRRSPTQPFAPRDRDRPTPHRPRHTRLRRPPPTGGQDQPRDHQMPEALRRPPTVPTTRTHHLTNIGASQRGFVPEWVRALKANAVMGASLEPGPTTLASGSLSGLGKLVELSWCRRGRPSPSSNRLGDQTKWCQNDAC